MRCFNGPARCPRFAIAIMLVCAGSTLSFAQPRHLWDSEVWRQSQRGTSAGLPFDPAGPAAPPIPDDWEFEYDLFASLLEHQGLHSVSSQLSPNNMRSWNSVFRDPAQSVAVITGDPSGINRASAFIDFVREGGMILLATNQSLRIPGVVGIQFRRVLATNDAVTYQNMRDCVVVRDLDRSSELMQNVDSIVTNRTGWISPLERSWQTSAWNVAATLPEGVRPDAAARQPLLALSQRKSSVSGQMIVLADGSPLTNGMLWHGSNVQFAINLSALLARDRTTFAFINHSQPVANRIPVMLLEEAVQRAPMPTPEIPPEALRNLPLNTLTKVANHVITRVEDSNVVNRLAVNRPRAMPDRFFRRAILLGLAVVAGAFFLVRSWLTAQPTPAWSKGDRRSTVALPVTGTPQTYEQAAMALSRQACAELADSVEPDDWSRQLGDIGPVRKEFCEASHDPAVTEMALDHVLTWSAPPEGRRLSQEAFLQVGNSVRHLRQLAGNLRIGGAGRIRSLEGR